MPRARDLHDSFVHLGLGATAVAQPAFTGMDWYADYISRHGEDGAEGRLVSLYRFAESWNSWERHPAGEELVLCISGHITLIQESASGEETRIVLAPGQYAINPANVWHTADVDAQAQALFVTPGLGTEHRPR